MAIQIVPFVSEHMRQIDLQEAQEWFNSVIDDTYAMRLEEQESFTVKAGDKVIACAGIIRPWGGRACAWTLLSKDIGPHFISIHKAVQRYFDLCTDRRIEAVTDCGFEQGHRWLRMLGFKHEGTLRVYTPDGRDVDLYARVRNV